MKRRGKKFEHHTLFVSGAVSGRVPLFQYFLEANEIFLTNLDFYRSKYGYQLRGYVIMPDHYHLLLTVQPGTSLPDLLRDFKSQVGRQVLDRLKSAGKLSLLRRFQLQSPPKRTKDPRHRILQYDNDIVEVFTREICRGKLRYMHNNPVAKGLVSAPSDWPYSSWKVYHAEVDAPIQVDKIGALEL